MESLEEWLTQPDGLASRLRSMRRRADLTGKYVADAHGWAQSKVSRIENGKQVPSIEDIEAWAETCHGDPAEVEDLKRLRGEANASRATFHDRMRRGQSEVQQHHNNLVANAGLIRHFETAFVPGLLQVPDYMRCILTEMRDLHNAIDDVDAAVATRMQRQRELYDPAKRFEFLLAEPVLRWLLCPPAVMRAQLDRLQTVIGLEQVRFGILPMGVRLRTSPQNNFIVYVGEESVVAVENFLKEESYSDESEVAHFNAALDRMWDDAVTGEGARELLISAAQALPRETDLEAPDSLE